MTDTTRNTIEDDLRRQLAALGDKSARALAHFADANDLVPTDLRALVMLNAADIDGGAHLTPGDLSRNLDLSSGAVTYLVDRLTRADLVIAARDDKDRRRTRIRCTPQGTALVRKFESGMQSVGSLAVMDLDEQDLARTAVVLERLDRALDSYCERFDN